VIQLDPDHRYWEIQEGRRREVPGVSHILDVMEKKGKFYRTNSKFYMTRGSYAHKAAALDVQGNLDEKTVDPEITGYLKAWRTFRVERKVTVLATEKPVYHEELDYCGTLDAVVVIEGIAFPIVLDLKSGSPAPWHVLQVAAYVLGHAGAKWKSFGGGVLYLKQNARYRLEVFDAMTLDRKIAEWEDLTRQFHQKESKLWQ